MPDSKRMQCVSCGKSNKSFCQLWLFAVKIYALALYQEIPSGSPQLCAIRAQHRKLCTTEQSSTLTVFKHCFRRIRTRIRKCPIRIMTICSAKSNTEVPTVSGAIGGGHITEQVRSLICIALARLLHCRFVGINPGSFGR